MFYKFDNFCIYIKKVFGNKNKNKTIEKQFLILKQTQSTMVYGSKFKILTYTINWDDAAFASKFYEKLKNKVKNAMVAMDKPESLKNMINIAVKIDDRQHDKFVDKKTWSKPIPKNKPQFKKNLIEFDVTEKKDLKKTLLRLRETGSFKTKFPKKKQWKCRKNGLKSLRNPKQSPKLTTKIYHGQHAATTNVKYTDHLKQC